MKKALKPSTLAGHSVREYAQQQYAPAAAHVFSSVSNAVEHCFRSFGSSTQLQSPVYVACTYSKAEEAARQIGRLKPYLSLGEQDSERDKNIYTAIGILNNLCVGPLPVPVASIGDENSTLFYDRPNFYGDIEIKDNKAEYYLRWRDNDKDKEIYGEENINNEFLPINLLAHLYQHLAKSE